MRPWDPGGVSSEREAGQVAEAEVKGAGGRLVAEVRDDAAGTCWAR